MVIDDLDVIGIPAPPFKANSPLIVDADAVKARPVARKFFESIPRRDTKIRQFIGSVQDQKLPERGPLEFWRPPAHRFTGKDPLGVSVAEALDHSV